MAYIDAIQQLAKEKYDEVLLVLNYINQGNDTDYWKGVFEIKKQEFLKLVRYRTTILTMIQEFEQKFFIKYQASLREILEPYLRNLLSRQATLDEQYLTVMPNEQASITYQQIVQQIVIIQIIFNATTLDEIINQIPAYLYLKQVLE